MYFVYGLDSNNSKKVLHLFYLKFYFILWSRCFLRVLGIFEEKKKKLKSLCEGEEPCARVSFILQLFSHDPTSSEL